MLKCVAEWTSQILHLSRNGLKNGALSHFIRMMRNGVQPSEFTFSATIGASTQLPSCTLGLNLHSLILKRGFGSQVFVCSGLISLYSKYRLTMEARRVFDAMVVRDAVSWNSMITGYANNGFAIDACSLFRDMLKDVVNWSSSASRFSLASILKACASLGHVKIGRSIHGYAVQLRCDTNVYVGGAIIDMYSKCGDVNLGRRIFDGLHDRDVAVWNAMIAGYARHAMGDEAVELFCRLRTEHGRPNEVTLLSALTASTSLPNSFFGKCLHSNSLTFGFASDVFVGTATVDMYAKFGHSEDAEKCFVGMAMKNLVTFNALLTGYGLIGAHEKAILTYMELHNESLRPDAFTLTALLSACWSSSSPSSAGTLTGLQAHSHSVMSGFISDVSVGNSVMNFYSRCGLPENALKVFRTLRTPNVLSWAGIISNFTQNGDGVKAVEYFCKLHRETNCAADVFSSSLALNAVVSCGPVQIGEQVHGHVMKAGLQDSAIVGSALISMYSKYGFPQHALDVFNGMRETTVVCWNSLLSGYAHNGLFTRVLALFGEMKDSGLLPTPVTFIPVLFACSHSGLVEEGKGYYDSMAREYMIPPSKEHCTCIVDLLGRSGYLHEAEEFLLGCPFSQEPEIWGCFLSACTLHRNPRLGTEAIERMSLRSRDSSIYAGLSNIYALNESWEDVIRVRELMEQTSSTKQAGSSWMWSNPFPPGIQACRL